MTLPPEPSDQYLIILLHKVEAAVVRDEGCDLLPILDELDSDTLPNGRVRLLRLHPPAERETRWN